MSGKKYNDAVRRFDRSELHEVEQAVELAEKQGADVSPLRN